MREEKLSSIVTIILVILTILAAMAFGYWLREKILVKGENIMEIKLTKEQYENLIKLVYLGNWMVNAIRSGQPGDEQIEKFNQIEQYIFAFAKDFGLKKYIEFDEKFNQFFPTREFEEDPEIEKYREEYDEEIFWEELIGRLAWRDFVKEYGQEAIKKMTIEEKIEKEYPFEEKYRKEFEENDLANLEILKKLNEIL